MRKNGSPSAKSSDAIQLSKGLLEVPIGPVIRLKAKKFK
jgi:hypothetical protein